MRPKALLLGVGPGQRNLRRSRKRWRSISKSLNIFGPSHRDEIEKELAAAHEGLRLAVTVKSACKLIGVGNTKMWSLIKEGKVDTTRSAATSSPVLFAESFARARFRGETMSDARNTKRSKSPDDARSAIADRRSCRQSLQVNGTREECDFSPPSTHSEPSMSSAPPTARLRPFSRARGLRRDAALTSSRPAAGHSAAG